MKHNWAKIEKQQDSLQRLVKRRKKTTVLFSIMPEEGYMVDPLNGELKKLSDCTTTTLNRFVKSLNTMYKATDLSETKNREFLLNKKIEIEKEIAARDE